MGGRRGGGRLRPEVWWGWRGRRRPRSPRRRAERGGEVGQERPEAVDGQTVRGAFPAGLGAGRRGGAGGGDGRWPGGLGRGGIVVVEEQRGERAAHVPLDAVGEHAEKDVGADRAFKAVVDGPHPDIDGLVAAERPLYPAQAPVGPHRVVGREFLGGHVGADDADAVQRSPLRRSGPRCAPRRSRRSPGALASSLAGLRRRTEPAQHMAAPSERRSARARPR